MLGIAAACLATEAGAVPTLQVKFAGAQSRVGTGSLSYPYRLAVDASGNLYISNTQGNEVLKETWSASTKSYTESVVVSSGLATPYGVAVDASGNVYVADNGHNRVVKEAPSGSGYTQTVVSSSALSYPTGVAVDSAGNLYIADTGHGRIVKEVPSGSSYTETALTNVLFAQITGIAVDPSGDIFVSDIDNWAIYEETYSAGSYTVSTVPTSGLNYPYDVAVDTNGNLYIADFTNKRIVKENFVSPGNYTQSVFPTANLAGPLGLAVDGAGDVYIADTFGQQIEAVTLAGEDFGDLPVGSPSLTVNMHFSFSGGLMGDTVGLTSIATLTQGVAGLDFASTGTESGVCSTDATYSAGDSCWVDVVLTPQYPGARYGGVELFGTVNAPQVRRGNNATGSLLATGYMSGTGTGPEVNYQPFSFSNVTPVASSMSPYNLANPFDSAVDAGGNVYVLDYNNAAYLETLAAGAYTQSTIATGLIDPQALALDGAGNLYIVDSGNNQILKESLVNGSWVQSTVVTGLNFPSGVAVDGNGNVFYSSFNDGAVYELVLSSGGYSAPVTLVTGLNQPRKIALDGSGDIFVADTGNSRVVEETFTGSGYTQTVVGSDMHYPYAVTVGAAGQVYVADTIHSRILLETPSGGGFTQSVLIPGPPAYGIAVDGQGSLYFPDPNDETVFKVSFSTPPSFSFASTIIGQTSSDSPESFSLWNIGNVALNLPVPGSGTNPAISDGFVLDASTTCPEVTTSGSAGTLDAGATCLYAINFEPTTVSSYSGSLTLTDNSLNGGGAGPQFKSFGQLLGSTTQTIPLSGTGLPLPATKLALTGVPSSILAGGNLGTATVDVEDMNSGIVTGSSAAVQVTVTGPGGYSQSVIGLAASGVYSANLTGLPLTTVGIYTVTAISDNLTSASATVVVEPAPASLGNLPVGTAGAAITVTFPFAASVTLGTPGVVVVTQGATGLDFANAGTGTCTAGGTVSAGGSCTVSVAFTPSYPGPRYGAVLLEDASGNVIATAYLHGTGVGPQALFPPGTQSTLTPDLTTYWPEGIAVDSKFNLFFVDGNSNSGGGAIVEFPWTGSSYGTPLAPASLNLPGGGYYPTGTLAADGAGNLYTAISNGTSGSIVKFPWNGSTYGTAVSLGSGLAYPISVAVDGGGNVFIADPSNFGGGSQQIVEIPWEGGSANNGYGAQATIASSSALGGGGGQYPVAVAVDPSGNLFFVGLTGPTTANLEEIPLVSGSFSSSYTTIDNGLYNPLGLAVDTNGNLYVNDSNDSGTSTPVYEYLLTAGTYGARTQLFTTPLGGGAPLALDSAGSLYMDTSNGDGEGAIYKQNRAVPPAVAFAHPTDVDAADSADNPQTVTLLNYGNANLGFASPSTGANPAISGASFTLDAATTCPKLSTGAAAVNLSANSACVYAVDFTPQSPGALSGTAVLTDNNLNHAATTQSIALSGTGVAVLGSFTLTGLPATSVAGVSSSFVLTAKDAQGLVMASYTGTVNLTSSDAQAVFSLTAGGAAITSYTFQNSDAGVKTIFVTFKTAGSETATAADTTAEVTANSASDLVTAAAAASISAVGSTSFTTTIGAILGVPEVSVADAYGNPVSGVTITYAAPTSGPSAILSSSAVETSGGIISVAAYANGIAGGPYTITASATGLTGSPVSFSGTNLADTTATTLGTAPGATSAYGTEVTLTATVTPAQPEPPNVVRAGKVAASKGKATPEGSFNGPPAVGPPTGTVSFYDTVGSSTRLLGTSTVGGTSGSSPDGRQAQPQAKGTPPIAGTATFSIVAPAGGGHSYTASYAGDPNFTASASSVAPYTVTLATATVAGPATQPVQIVVGQAGSIPITVTGPKTGLDIAVPTGAVNYTILNAASVQVGTGTVNLTAGATGSTVSIPTSSSLAPGLYTIQTSYVGDGNYAASTSPVAVEFEVGKIQTSIVWAQPAAIVYGTSLGAILDATAKAGSTAVAGTFAYTATPTGGTATAVTEATVLGAGSYTLTVSFTPTDGATYAASTGSVTLSVGQATATIALVSSANPQYVQDPISFTATVTSTAGVPTGSVAFYDGETLLGTVSLASGVAVYTTSSLAKGAHSITAVYLGDANFGGATSSAVAESVQDFNLTISTTSGGSSTATASPGGSATYPLVFTPVDGMTFPQVVNLTVSGLPPGATGTLTPDTLPAGSGTTPVTLTVKLANSTALLDRSKPFRPNRLPLALGLILLPFAGRIRRVLRQLRASRRVGGWLTPVLLAAIGLAVSVGLASCGGKPSGYFGQAPQTYILTITGTSGALSHSTTVTLTVE